MNHEIQLKTVERIAQSVRQWAEATANKIEPDAAHDLAGWCAVASGRLYKELEEEGFAPLLACGDHHCFVLLGELVIDVTATQFDETSDERILIKKHTELKELAEHWDEEVVCANRREMRRWQLAAGWPEKWTVATPDIRGC